MVSTPAKAIRLLVAVTLVSWGLWSCSSGDTPAQVTIPGHPGTFTLGSPDSTQEFNTASYTIEGQRYYETRLSFKGQELRFHADRNMLNHDLPFDASYTIVDTLHARDTTKNRAVYLVLRYKNKPLFTFLPVLRIDSNWLRADFLSLFSDEDRSYAHASTADSMVYKLRTYVISNEESFGKDIYSHALFLELKSRVPLPLASEDDVKTFYLDVMKLEKERYAFYKRYQVYFSDSFEADYLIRHGYNPFISIAQERDILYKDKNFDLSPYLDSMNYASPLNESFDMRKADHIMDSMRKAGQ